MFLRGKQTPIKISTIPEIMKYKGGLVNSSLKIPSRTPHQRNDTRRLNQNELNGRRRHQLDSDQYEKSLIKQDISLPSLIRL
ncbi:hypothetical protein PO124_19775 [Bacillus licheniformis]|nr:hypothetical protein [Bacillus licheniformis]